MIGHSGFAKSKRSARRRDSVSDTDILKFLAVALAAGLIIGFERGWHERTTAEGQRVAGIRTFALIGLSGDLVSIIGVSLSVALSVAITLGFVGLLVAIRIGARDASDIGATTEVASIVAFSLGVLAGMGHVVPKIAGAVVTALLLGAKPALHRWLSAIEEKELSATLQFLLISAVVLPLLPNEGYGPYVALNPYRLWLMVVLVAGLSFAGYLIVKLMGTGRGVILTGITGGLVASTATSLALLRAARVDSEVRSSVPAAVIATNTIMVMRMPLLAIAIHPPLLPNIAIPFAALALAGLGLTAALWPSEQVSREPRAPIVHSNPLALQTALGFAVVLAIVTLLVEAIKNRVGTVGIYGLATLSGLIDVDAITLSLADQASRQLDADVVAVGLICASGTNTLVKIAIAIAIGPTKVARTTAWALLAMLMIGACAVAAQLFVKSI